MVLGPEVSFKGLLSWEMCVKAESFDKRRKLDGGRQMVGRPVSAPPQHQGRSLFEVLLGTAAADFVLESAVGMLPPFQLNCAILRAQWL